MKLSPIATFQSVTSRSTITKIAGWAPMSRLRMGPLKGGYLETYDRIKTIIVLRKNDGESGDWKAARAGALPRRRRLGTLTTFRCCRRLVRTPYPICFIPWLTLARFSITPAKPRSTVSLRVAEHRFSGTSLRSHSAIIISHRK
jgi:hypothetical protein